MDGLDMILLAYVYEETGIAFLRTAAVLLTALFIIGILAGHLLQFGGILIISYKPPELTGHYALDDVVLVHPVQAAEYLGQETLYLLLVHLYALQVINHLVELFLAYLGTGRHLALNELLAYGFLYETDLSLLAQVDNRY